MLLRNLERATGSNPQPSAWETNQLGKAHLSNALEMNSLPLSNDTQVTLDFSRPGKPTDNPFIESFNGSFRDECLNVNWFLSLEDAKEKIQLFKEEYNGFRPHSSWSGLTPNEVVQQHSHGPIFSILGR
jgi:putative transposase